MKMNDACAFALVIQILFIIDEVVVKTGIIPSPAHIPVDMIMRC